MQTTMKVRPATKKPARAVESLLGKIVKGKKLLKRRKGAKLFSQGEAADAIYFVQTGKIQLTVVSPQNKKVVMAMVGPHDFVGEECHYHLLVLRRDDSELDLTGLDKIDSV